MISMFLIGITIVVAGAWNLTGLNTAIREFDAWLAYAFGLIGGMVLGGGIMLFIQEKLL